MALQFLQRAAVLGLRAALIFLFCATVYVIVGSWMFPEWWYGIFWDGRFKDRAYIADALRYLGPGSSGLVLWIVIGAFVLSILLMIFAGPVLGFVDRFSKAIALVCIGAIMVDVLLLYKYRLDYEFFSAISEAGKANLAPSFRSLGQPAEIQPPIYFHYLNAERVNALYKQLEPELEETSRSIKSSANLKGEAEVSAGVGKITVGADKSGERESKYERSSFPPERQCLEVMKYVRKTWPDSYYSSAFDLYVREAFRPIVQNLDIIEGGGTPAPPKTLNPDELKQKVAFQMARLQSELRTAHGLLFVDGDFTRNKSGGLVVLVHDFALTPLVGMPKYKVRFRVTLPATAPQSLPKGSTVTVRVFGDVTKPLGNDGFIDVAPVSIF